MAETPIERVIEEEDDGESGPIGIFPSWNAVYISVVIYTLALIGLLAWFTSAFDYTRVP